MAIVGSTGTGKSHLARAFERPIRRLLHLDPFLETELGGGTLTCAELHARADDLRTGVVRHVVQPEADDWNDLPELLARVCDEALRIGNLCLVIDEISFWCEGPSPSQTPGEFRRAIVAGRHDRVSLVVIAQRFTQIPTDFRGNLSRIFAFRQPDPDDAHALARRMATPGLAPEIQRVADRHFYDWTPQDGARLRQPLPR